jgi:hypothetical protein
VWPVADQHGETTTETGALGWPGSTVIIRAVLVEVVVGPGGVDFQGQQLDDAVTGQGCIHGVGADQDTAFDQNAVVVAAEDRPWQVIPVVGERSITRS